MTASLSVKTPVISRAKNEMRIENQVDDVPEYHDHTRGEHISGSTDHVVSNHGDNRIFQEVWFAAIFHQIP